MSTIALPIPRRAWRPLATAGRHIGLAALVGLGLLSLAWQLAQYPHAASAAQWRYLHPDFVIYHDAATAARHGWPLYRTGTTPGNNNPPVLTLALLPLAWLPLFPAYVVFTSVCLAAWLAALVLTVREVGWPRAPGMQLAILAALAAFPGIINTLKLGEPSLLYAPLVVLAWRAMRRAQPVRAGLLWGALVLLKPWLLPVLALFVVWRWWRGAVAVLVAPLVLVAVTLPRASLHDWWDWLALLRHVAPGGWGIAQAWNIGLVGLLVRAGVVLPAWVLPCLPFVASALGLWLVTRLHLRADRDRQLAVLVALALLLCPLGWLYYLQMLMPALVVAVRSRLGRLALALLWLYPVAPLLALALALTRNIAVAGLALLVVALSSRAAPCGVPAPSVPGPV